MSILSCEHSSPFSPVPKLQGSSGHYRRLHDQFPSFFSFLHCPLGLGELQACPFPDVVFPPLFRSASSSCTFSLCLARWFWQDLMNGRHVHTTSVCISLQWTLMDSCWILAQTSSLVTWSLYEMRSILRWHFMSPDRHRR